MPDLPAIQAIALYTDVAAFALFVAVAALAWAMRNRMLRSPAVAYASGLGIAGLGFAFSHFAATGSGASTVFSAGLIGLGASMVATALAMKATPRPVLTQE